MSKRLTKNEMPRTMLGVLGPKQILVSDMVGAAGRSVMRVPRGWCSRSTYQREKIASR